MARETKGYEGKRPARERSETTTEGMELEGEERLGKLRNTKGEDGKGTIRKNKGRDGFGRRGVAREDKGRN